MNSGKYNPSVHAVERIRARFGVMEENAKAFVNEMMRGAKYVTTQSDGKLVYKCAKRDAMLVVNANTKTIVTVLPQSGTGDNNADTVVPQSNGILTEVIRATVERELRKASVLFRRTYRQYTLKLADVNVEIAELFRNKVRCKHPGTQAIIQSQIDVLEDEARAIQNAMQTQESEYRAIEQEASVYLRTEGEMVS